MPDKLLTYNELAAKLQLNPVTLRQWVSQGRIPYRKLGKAVRFSNDDVVKIINNGPTVQGAAL
jgi:excisionase family DNA binding protein